MKISPAFTQNRDRYHILFNIFLFRQDIAFHIIIIIIIICFHLTYKHTPEIKTFIYQL